ncbi:vicilin Jug r 2.0101 [Ziziphus jujuba]|uniref:Vicilin Jug r 2.0101 n=1 Tax=Ziziphus jujuba TaxID=326968 RepID=A0A6P3YW75_ZIZJJ|nr:vicilin Jug r 2.0101 [Ziziphus jujuba]
MNILTPKPNRLLIPLFFFFFFLSFFSTTFGYYDFDSKSKQHLQQCFDKCTQDVQQIAQKLVCQKACVQRDLENYKEEEEEKGGGGGQPFPEISPQDEYQQCWQWCLDEVYDDPRKLKKCQQRCDEKLRKREAEEEGGRGGGTKPEPEPEREPEPKHEKEPEKNLRHCQRRCVRRYGTGQERQICKRTCRKQYDKEKGYEGPPDVIDSLDKEVPPGKQYEHCRKSCQRQSQDQRQLKKCESQCQKESSQKEFQREEDEEEKEELESWESNSMISYKGVPGVKYQKCQQKCEGHKQSESPEMKMECQQKCEKKYGSDKKQRQRGKEEKIHRQGQGEKGKETEKEHQEQGEKGSESPEEVENKGEKGKETKNPTRSETEEERIRKILRNNPYYFPSDGSQSMFRTQEGQLKVFDVLSKKSNLLQGIENYRFAVLEAGPNTFVIPHHYDAESVLVVVRGKGTISLVSQKGRDSYYIEFGDIIRVPVGTTIYLINQQNDENLEIAQLLQPINNPGQFKEYFVAGGHYPQSYYRAFSTHLLYQILNVSRDQVDRFLGQESRGKWQGLRQAIAIKASQEQLRALSHHEYSTSSVQIINSNSKGPIRLRNKKPFYSNEFGKILEANPDEHRQIRDLDVFVHLVEIKKGAIMVPHHHSRSTLVGLVVEGSGHFEMVCPHFSSHGGDDDDDGNEEKNNRLQVNRAVFSPGDVFVVAAGHPISYIPDPYQNLTILEFGINGLNNHRNFIAGRDSIVMKMERAAKELAFNVEGEEVEQIFGSQKLSYFVPKLETEQEELQGGK